MQEKCILFDLDGTLTDPFRGITRSVQYSLEKFGIHAELEELKRKTRPVWNLFSDTLSQELIDLVVATQQ